MRLTLPRFIRRTPTASSLLLLSTFVLPLLASANANMTPMEGYEDPPLVNESITVMDPDRFPAATYPAGHVLDNTVPWKTDVAEFDPNGQFSVETKEKVVADESRRTNAYRGPMMPRPPGTWVEEDLRINQGQSPESNVPARQVIEDLYSLDELLEPGHERAGICTFNQQYLLNETFFQRQGFGNNTFGAGYEIDTYLRVSQLSNGKKFEARAEGKIYATAFGWTQDIARVYAQVENSPTVAEAKAEIIVMGGSVWSPSRSSEISYTKKFTRHFFRSQKVFMVGPVPVRVTASLNGTAGLEVAASAGVLTSAGVELKATPEVSVDATATAGVDVVVASFGISGSLRLIGVSFPVTKSATIYNNRLNWNFKVDRSLSTLSGNISAYAIVRFIFFRIRWDVTIFSWSGGSSNQTLANRSGSPSISTSFTPSISTLSVP